jgi:hypothetical protein
MTPLLGPFNNNLKLSKIKLLNQKLCNGEIWASLMNLSELSKEWEILKNPNF